MCLVGGSVEPPFLCRILSVSNDYQKPGRMWKTCTGRMQSKFELDSSVFILLLLSVLFKCQRREKFSNSDNIKWLNEKCTANKRTFYLFLVASFIFIFFLISIFISIRSMPNEQCSFYFRWDNSIEIGFLFSAIKLK